MQCPAFLFTLIINDHCVSNCAVRCRSSRSRATGGLSAPESDDVFASQELAYHAFVDCADLHHHYHYTSGHHLRHHGDEMLCHQHHQQQQLIDR